MMLVWWVPILNPIKLLVVLFHELSHAVTGLLTGGVVFGIAIDPGGAGITLGMGGWVPLVMTAGYVGSLLIGALLYYLCAVWNPTEVWVVVTIFAMLALPLRAFNEFTSTFVLATVGILLAGLLLKPEMKRVLLRLVATTSCLYPLLDVMGEIVFYAESGFTFNGRHIGSDVSQIADLAGVPPVMIALLWISAGVSAVWMLMFWTAEIEARTEYKRSILLRDRVEKVEEKTFQVEKRLVYTKAGPYNSHYTIK